MGQPVVIESGEIKLSAELNDSETAKEISELLPLTGTIRRWGEELYFCIPLSRGLESDARDEVEVGELGYWPTGEAFCIFWGPTPASDGDKPKAAGPVNVIGMVKGDATVLSATQAGDEIKVSAG
ncbi:MAG: cyclophilin-like fold protein [bacterium]